MQRTPNVFTIPNGVPFLPALAEAIVSGTLVPGWRPLDDPLLLADATLFLPTRRAARAIPAAFAALLGDPSVLPRIVTLGDPEEGLLPFRVGAEASLPPAVPPAERQLRLARLVEAWAGAVARAGAGFEPVCYVPSSASDAVRLAGALGDLIDEAHAAGVDWSRLADLGGDLSQFWNITVEFLKIVTEFWPAHLAETGRIDGAARRDRLLALEAARLALGGAGGPVIAAGSAATLPSTLALLKAIARAPLGAVVLPGLDHDLDRESFDLIGRDEDDPAAAAHPQAGLKRLMSTVGVTRDGCPALARPASPLALRARFVSDAFRPAAATDRWGTPDCLSAEDRRAALSGLHLLEARHEGEEALCIALLLRRALHDGQTAALVTPDRGLARRVSAELERWGVRVDDSGGEPLAQTPAGALMRLTLDVAFGRATADNLLSLLKHPMVTLGKTGSHVRRAARALERAVLRGPALPPRLDLIRDRLRAEMAARAADPERRGTEASRTLFPEDWARADEILDALSEAFSPLRALAADKVEPCRFATALLDAIGRLTAGPEGEPSALGADEAAHALLDGLAGIAGAEEAGFAIHPADAAPVFDALLGGLTVRRRGGLDPRIQIWGTLEARLQSVDVAVLGGLNEGIWPSAARSDPFLSRSQRRQLGLQSPEEAIGVAAHDMAALIAQPTVWLCRAERVGGQPRSRSRWLERLIAFAGAEGAQGMASEAADLLAIARRLDEPQERLPPAPRPAPSPPVEARPRKLSVTEIETLIRDPYAIYARHVLGLRPFEAPGEAAGAANRGTVIHAALERFVTDAAANRELGLDRLLAIGREVFEALGADAQAEAIWWPRFEKAARWFVEHEGARAHVVERRVEVRGVLALGDFTLTCRADRIDRLADGTLAIIDYKTGTPPSEAQALSTAPQLLLTGLLARNGAFDGVSGEPSEISYYRFHGRGEGGEVASICAPKKGRGKDEALSLSQAIALTEERLGDLLARYARPDARYLSRAIPREGRDWGGPYDHLARVGEWGALDPDEGGIWDGGEAAE